MLPVFRQRLLIAAAAALGAVILWMARHPLAATDASAGISLLDARVGVIGAIALVLVAAAPAVALGLLTSATAHPLSGVFVLATSLTVLAGAGGSIEGFLRRHEAGLPGVYQRLLIETLIWAAALAGFLSLAQRLRPLVRPYVSALATQDHWGHDLTFARPRSPALLAGLICAVIGGVLTHLMVQTHDTGQVIGSLIVAFTAGATTAHLILPQANPAGILLSPAAVALGGYAWAIVSHPVHDAFLADWYSGSLSGLALVLPIHYLSAGVVGCSLGIGLAQSLDHARTRAAEASNAR